MITKKDFDGAVESWAAEERESLGGRPTEAEIEAYLRGELSREERARIRALLVYDPELTHLLIEPRRSYWPLVHAVAGVIIAVLSVSLYLSRTRVNQYVDEPQVIGAAHILQAHHPRSARAPQRPYELPANETLYHLIPTFIDERAYPQYRMTLVDVSGGEAKTVWSADGVRREHLEILVPRAYLHAGDYRLDVYGLQQGKSELLEQFPLRVRGE